MRMMNPPNGRKFERTHENMNKTCKVFETERERENVYIERSEELKRERNGTFIE